MDIGTLIQRPNGKWVFYKGLLTEKFSPEYDLESEAETAAKLFKDPNAVQKPEVEEALEAEQVSKPNTVRLTPGQIGHLINRGGGGLG